MPLAATSALLTGSTRPCLYRRKWRDATVSRDDQKNIRADGFGNAWHSDVVDLDD